MKKGALLLIFALVAGIAAFCFMRSHKMAAHRESLLDTMPELAWLRSDLHLSDEQFAKVSELHAAYRPKCIVMCQRIAEAHGKLEALAHAGRQVDPELAAAIRDHARVHVECQQAMLEHLYRTAAVLDEKQRTRYLDTMLPYALDFSHSEPATLHAH